MKEAKEIIKFAGMEIHFFLDADDTNNGISMFKCVISPGAKMGVPHYHEHFDETVYGLKGVITYVVNGKPVDIGPGDYLFIPRGAVHGFSNQYEETSEFLAVANPAVFGPAYFREVGAVLNAGGPPDIPKLKAVMANHGLVPAM